MIIVMGEPGAGKTTVLSKSLERLPDWKCLVYGDLMFEIAKKMKVASHKDDIRKQPAAVQKKIQASVASFLSKQKGKIFLDTHCSIVTPGGYIPGLPFALLSKLKVERLIYVSAPVKDIASRRQRDLTRKRDSQSVDEIQEHGLINRAFLCSYSAFTSAPIAIIQNPDGGMEQAVYRFVSIVERG